MTTAADLVFWVARAMLYVVFSPSEATSQGYYVYSGSEESTGIQNLLTAYLNHIMDGKVLIFIKKRQWH